MLTPYLGAPALAVLFFACLTALGAGAATMLVGRTPAALLLAPALGLGLGTSLLTTLSALTPLRLAGPIALAVGIVVSLGVAFTQRLRRPTGVAALLPPALVFVSAVALALFPVLAHGTYGPVNLYFMDSWFYVAADEYLMEGTLEGAVPGNPALDPTYATVDSIQRLNTRLGIDTLQAAAFRLTRTSAIAGQYPIQAAYIATVGVTTYGLARLGTALRPWWCAAAGLLAVALPLTAELWVDPRPANLVAVVLAPLVLFFGGRSVLTGDLRAAGVAGIAVAGIVVSYIEHAPTIALAGAMVAAVGLIRAAGTRPRYLKLLALTVLVAAGIAFILSPPGWLRAYDYARSLGAGVGGPPIAGLDVAAISTLLAGTAHVYELARIPLTAPVRATVLFDVTAAALALCAVGVAMSTRLRGGLAGLTYGSLLVASAILALYFRLSTNCGDYCVQKALTLAGPPVAVTLTLGAAFAWGWTARSRVLRVALVGFLAVYGAFVARATLGLERGAATVPMAVDQRDLEIPEAIEALPDGAPILIEGAEAVGDIAVFFDIPAALELADSDDNPLRYDTSLGGALAGGSFPGEAFRADYRYVLTRFPGLDRDSRRTLERFGQYALQQRTSRTDVAVVAASGTRDPRDAGRDAVPWLRGPVTLRVVGARAGTTLRVRLRGAGAASTQWSASGGSVRLVTGAGRSELCVRVPPGPPTRDVILVPAGLAFPQPAREPTQAFQRSPRALALAGIDTGASARAACR